MKRRKNPGSAVDLLLVLGMAGGGYLLAKAGTLGPEAQHFVSGLTGSGNPPIGTPGPAGTYTTGNGPKTLAQMHAELDLAANSGKPGGKWSGDGASPDDPVNIQNGYAKITGKPVTGPS